MGFEDDMTVIVELEELSQLMKRVRMKDGLY